MPHGLQVYNAAGVLTFDSALATGGVCLGFFTIPAQVANTEFTFPEYGPGRTGFMINTVQNGESIDHTNFSFDNALGYPRFSFAYTYFARTVLLFIK